MMDGSKHDPLNELDWLEFFANQRGWDNLAQRIAQDVAESHEREHHIANSMDQLRLERDAMDDERAA